MLNRLPLAATLAAAALLLAPAPGQAQTSPQPLFERMAGHWVLRGTIHGQATVHDVDAEVILNHAYVRLHEVSRETKADGSPAYEAIVTLGVDPKTGDFTCMWLDNTEPGGLTPAGIARGRATADTLPLLFGGDGDDRIRTTFAYDREGDRWEWRIDNELKGIVKPFARMTMTRR